ncbi:hypothetical protein TNCV_3226671 [Trichonephila clavipes]|nr:hypothetical protein TNCV_3226671 [Trichonephila clavipes]
MVAEYQGHERQLRAVVTQLWVKILVPLKVHLEERGWCTLNISRGSKSTQCECLERGVSTQMSSSSSDRGLKLRGS